MNPDNLILRYEQVHEQVEGPVRRIVGFVKAKNMLALFDAADLDANPRSAKAGPVTEAIIESIVETPETFPFKTKGVLVGASDYDALDRRRYGLRFENTHIEGILDGGHNMLAIGTHILSIATNDIRIARKLKRWPDFKQAWEENRAAVAALRKISAADDGEIGPLDFLIPIEILVPSDVENPDIVQQFNSSLLDICAARNNNVELRLETKANQKGYYEALSQALPTDIVPRVEWKTNDGGEIKVRDLISLAWIPLSMLDLPSDEDGRQIEAPIPQNIYRNKGECVKLFDRLMGNPQVSRKTDGEYTHELHSEAVKSALQLAGQLPELYDRIYRDFPYWYNDGEGKFGRIKIVKMAKDMRSKPLTHFTSQEVEYNYPDGLIMPLVYGLKALMKKSRSGRIEWKVDPNAFLDGHGSAIVKKYRVILDAFNFDPQKIGKNEGSYNLVLDAFDTELLRLKSSS
ncbi:MULTISPECIES: hypothetical protein [unclassified Bradyrhizobium]|uniref:hypothetical protein n=1 Tax=unclassified Bradyrhizobium TaxID=2631580 RepID=UPI0029166C19|nr:MULTISPECIES: hypothetical protein [unclassified Bradyrhizobium]